MLCKKCNKNKATIFIDAKVNGLALKIALCEKCAASGFGIAAAPERSTTEKSEGSRTTVCPKCKTTFSKIERTRLFGCEKCYELFGSRLLSETEFAAANDKNDKKECPSHVTVGNLKKELAKAIEEEHYEKAAKLRDEIKKLES